MGKSAKRYAGRRSELAAHTGVAEARAVNHKKVDSVTDE